MNWAPFRVTTPGERPQPSRALNTVEGIGDRLRSAAFAEIQAREAFLWAANTFPDIPEELREEWRALALAEHRHMEWLLNRMAELNIDVQERRVSEYLWHSLISCKSAREFSVFMANAEERGQKAGFRFHEALVTIDPKSAEIFSKIAHEETAHIALARRYFPE